MLGVARALEANRGSGSINLCEIISRQFESGRADVFLEPMHFRRGRNRHNPWPLRQDPRERDLCRRRILARRKALEPLDEPEVRLAILRREPRKCLAEVSLHKRRVLVDGACEKATAKWTE